MFQVVSVQLYFSSSDNSKMLHRFNVFLSFNKAVTLVFLTGLKRYTVLQTLPLFLLRYKILTIKILINLKARIENRAEKI